MFVTGSLVHFSSVEVHLVVFMDLQLYTAYLQKLFTKIKQPAQDAAHHKIILSYFQQLYRLSLSSPAF